jgi:hypothetical protein
MTVPDHTEQLDRIDSEGHGIGFILSWLILARFVATLSLLLSILILIAAAIDVVVEPDPRTGAFIIAEAIALALHFLIDAFVNAVREDVDDRIARLRAEVERKREELELFAPVNEPT